MTRLGAQGGHEVRSHPWFDDFDFDALESHQLTAPFMPQLKEMPSQSDLKDIRSTETIIGDNKRGIVDQH